MSIWVFWGGDESGSAKNSKITKNHLTENMLFVATEQFLQYYLLNKILRKDARS